MNKQHLRYWIQTADQECGIQEHPQQVMRNLGITYRAATPQSMGDQWWFWYCSNVPEKLPEYLEVLKVTPHGNVSGDIIEEEENCRLKRSFTQLSRSYFAKILLRPQFIDEIILSIVSEEEDTYSEFAIRWTVIGGNTIPMLCAFNDSWCALWQCRDLLEGLSSVNGKNVSPDDMARYLVSLGFVDETVEEGAGGEEDPLYAKPCSNHPESL